MILLSACSPKQVVVRTKTVEIIKIQYRDIDPNYKCELPQVTGTWLSALIEHRQMIEKCQSELKRIIRTINQQQDHL